MYNGTLKCTCHEISYPDTPFCHSEGLLPLSEVHEYRFSFLGGKQGTAGGRLGGQGGRGRRRQGFRREQGRRHESGLRGLPLRGQINPAHQAHGHALRGRRVRGECTKCYVPTYIHTYVRFFLRFSSVDLVLQRSKSVGRT